MIDPQLIRQDPQGVKEYLKFRNAKVDVDRLVSLDAERRKLIVEQDRLSEQKNKLNDEISSLLKDKKDPQSKIAALKEVSKGIDALKPRMDELNEIFNKELYYIPNRPHADVPRALTPEGNRVVRSWGDTKPPSFAMAAHIELCEKLDLVDFARSSKIAGSSFLLFKGEGARLERALINFMIDTHTANGRYKEVSTPFMVKRQCMTGTGQLPKFEEDMYRLFRNHTELEDGKPRDEDMFLIPTAEVPVTNIHREEILDESELPINYVAYSPCFRLEAGSYGKDTKGMTRVHQFDKVELVKIVKPETSYAEHEALLTDAEGILKKLAIPYRVVLLCSSDMGFSAAKCYDIEVWAQGSGKWLEASSVSNFEDFQARRALIKYRDAKDKKSRFVHTLNGSGVALARTFIAVVENNQQPDGSILIPEVLRPYMGGQTHIRRK